LEEDFMNTCSSKETVVRPAREIPVRFDVDVAVVGGGSAGIAAAVSAAREGARTLLIERNGFLGGVMTATSLGGICGLYTLIDAEPVQMVYGFAEEVRQRLVARGATKGPLPWLKTASLPYDLYSMKQVCDDLAHEPGLRTLLHARVTDVMPSDGQVRTLIIRTRADECAVNARVVIDASGDAEVCALAGAPFEYDRATLQFPTAMFRMGGVDSAVARQSGREHIRQRLEQAVADGLHLPRTTGGIYSVRDGIVHLNITRVASADGSTPDIFDPIALTEAEFEGRRQATRYLEAFRRYVPGYQDAYILDSGSELGIRESRRIVGEQVVSDEDVTEERKFSDAIAKNCWPIEDHNADRSTRWVWLSPGGYSHIPYGALVPRAIDNVLVAGRCLSSSHDAQAALRVTANCFSMGQAAGVAAAFAAQNGGNVRQVPIKQLQARLEQLGASLGLQTTST
jgi:ribulose 1,5-bisphosphate synthetase/thiazole synthase